MELAAGAGRRRDTRHPLATFEPLDRWTGILVRLGGSSVQSRVEAHLRALKERAEAAESTSSAA